MKITVEQRAEIGRRYVDGEGSVVLGREYGCTPENIQRILRLLGIPRRQGRTDLRRRLKPDEVTKRSRPAFDFDDQPLHPYGDHNRLCIRRTCLGCGESRYILVSYVRSNYGKMVIAYCKGCYLRQPIRAPRGEKNHRWRGGRATREDGYIYLYRPDHPAATNGGYVAEHRLVMEEVLGRSLLRHESVHHINGVRNDNRPENLELWTRVQPSGIRAKDAPHCPTCTCHVHRSHDGAS